MSLLAKVGCTAPLSSAAEGAAEVEKSQETYASMRGELRTMLAPSDITRLDAVAGAIAAEGGREYGPGQRLTLALDERHNAPLWRSHLIYLAASLGMLGIPVAYRSLDALLEEADGPRDDAWRAPAGTHEVETRDAAGNCSGPGKNKAPLLLFGDFHGPHWNKDASRLRSLARLYPRYAVALVLLVDTMTWQSTGLSYGTMSTIDWSVRDNKRVVEDKNQPIRKKNERRYQTAVERGRADLARSHPLIELAFPLADLSAPAVIGQFTRGTTDNRKVPARTFNTAALDRMAAGYKKDQNRLTTLTPEDRYGDFSRVRSQSELSLLELFAIGSFGGAVPLAEASRLAHDFYWFVKQEGSKHGLPFMGLPVDWERLVLKGDRHIAQMIRAGYLRYEGGEESGYSLAMNETERDRVIEPLPLGYPIAVTDWFKGRINQKLRNIRRKRYRLEDLPDFDFGERRE